MAKRQPKCDTKFGDTRVRVYATRSEFEALVGEGEIDDPEAPVWVFPKIGTACTWAEQAYMNYRSSL